MFVCFVCFVGNAFCQDHPLESPTTVFIEELPTTQTLARNTLHEALELVAGTKGKIDQRQALLTAQQAAAMGDPVAKLAAVCLEDLTTTQPTKLAEDAPLIANVRRLADRSDITAAAILGRAYDDQLIQSDNATTNALTHLEKAATADDPLAMVWLASMLMDDGTSDTARAVALLDKALSKGSKRANVLLGRIFITDKKTTQGLTALAEAANAGAVGAANDLGRLFANGTPDKVLQPDFDQALKWWHYAADELGSHAAAFNLAILLRSGDVKPNAPQAVQYLQRAAEANMPEAQLELGKLHFYGEAGLDKDTTTALQWWQRAADLGNPRAMYNVAFVTGKDDEPRAAQLIQRAAAGGVTEAMYEYGIMLLYGKHTDQSTTRAADMFAQTAAQAAEEGNTTLAEKANAALAQIENVKPTNIAKQQTNAGQTALYMLLAFVGILALLILTGLVLMRKRTS